MNKGGILSVIGLCLAGVLYVLLKIAFMGFLLLTFCVCATLYKDNGVTAGAWGMVIIAFLVGGPIGVFALFLVGRR